jgi:hypothetical protein
MGAAHSPTNAASLLLPKHFKVSDIAIVPSAENKNKLEGIFFVYFSIALVVTSSFAVKFSILIFL